MDQYFDEQPMAAHVIRLYEANAHLMTENVRLRQALDDSERSLRQMTRIAMYDGLTKLINRAGLLAYVEARLQRGAFDCSLIFGDGQEFKTVNDDFGYETGDVALALYAEFQMSCTRTERAESEAVRILSGTGEQVVTPLTLAAQSADVVCRWGGEEFVIIVNGNAAAAQCIVSRIETRLHQLASARVRLNMGVVEASISNGEDFWRAIRQASEAMKVVKAAAKANP